MDNSLSMVNNLLGPFFSAFVVSTIVSLITIIIFNKKKWLDDPKLQEHKKIVHLKPVPRGGGVPIFFALVSCIFFFLPFDKHILGILLGATILTIVGFVDDLVDLNPYVRIITGLTAALFVVGAGIGIAYITNPFSVGSEVISLSQPQIAFFLLGKTRTIWLLADLFAFVWIVWTMNMVNWSKGVDGQMPGFVAIAAIFVGALSLRFSGDTTQWEVITLAMITAGAFLGLLVWNAYPQKIMPGYGGGSLAGYLLAVLAILSGAKVATLILVLAIPTFDAAYTIVRRILEKKSPVWGDRGHLHHRLLDLGWSKKSISYFYWVTTCFLGLFTLQLSSTQKLFSLILIGMTITAALFWLKLIVSSKNYEN